MYLKGFCYKNRWGFLDILLFSNSLAVETCKIGYFLGKFGGFTKKLPSQCISTAVKLEKSQI